MDTKKSSGTGHGIELSRTTVQGQGDRHSQPGLEAVDYSTLEVVSPRVVNPDPSRARMWEKGSGTSLPQYGSRPGPAPSYEYMGPPHGGMAKDGFFREDAICGVKRQTFWVVMAIGIFVMVAAVAIGVGLGVALHKSDDAPSTTPLPSANSSSPTTTPLPAPTATGTTGPEVVISCPANNRTLYSSGGGDKSYLVLCGRDYSSVDGAVDLFDEPMDSMSDCIDECAAQQGCVGVGWGPYNNRNTCWLKSKLGMPNVTPDWYFAVEDEGALGR